MAKSEAVYFIRHNSKWKFHDVPGNIERELFDAREIAVDFTWNPEWDEKGATIEAVWSEDHYDTKGKTAIRYFNELNESSGIVVAAYSDIDQILIGDIEIGSKYLKYPSESHPNGRLKTLHFDKKTCKVISLHDFSLPFLIAPPYSTLVRWEMGERAVRSFLSTGSMQVDNPDMYSAWHLEVLAEEFLRKRKILKYTYYKTGKSMKDYDIVGCNERDETILVQVKYDCSVESIVQFFSKIDSESEGLKTKIMGIFVVGKSGIKSRLPVEMQEHVIEYPEMMQDFKNEKGYLNRLLTGRISW